MTSTPAQAFAGITFLGGGFNVSGNGITTSSSSVTTINSGIGQNEISLPVKLETTVRSSWPAMAN